MISAILRVTNAEWRTPMTRLSEAITVLALITGAPMIIADLGRPDRIWHLLRYGRIQSPLIWDFLSVMTYLTACVIYFYLPLIPDLAILADDARFPEWRRKIYRVLSLSWRNTPERGHGSPSRNTVITGTRYVDYALSDVLDHFAVRLILRLHVGRLFLRCTSGPANTETWNRAR